MPLIPAKDIAVVEDVTLGHFITAKVAIRNTSGFIAKSVDGK